MDTITLTVRPYVLVTYVVASPAPAADLDSTAAAIAADIEAPPFYPPAEMLARGGLTVVETRFGEHPPVPIELLGALGATAVELAAVESAQRLIVVTAAQANGWANYGDWAACGVAATLAQRLHGVLIDPSEPRVLDPSAALATIPRTSDDFVLSKWVSVAQSMDDAGCWFTTTGMHRFGLPELQTIDVPPALTLRWGRVLTGIASRLIDLWCDALRDNPEASFLEMPAEFHLACGNVDVAFGRAETIGPDTTVRLAMDPAPHPDHTSFLTVVPPSDYPRSAGEFFAEVCDIVLGPAPSTTVCVDPSHELDDAITAARAELPAVRDRFLAGPMDAGTFLAVMHRVTHDDRTEFVWAAVMSWQRPDALHGTSIDDAELDASIRSGRPVRVESDKIVDWAVVNEFTETILQGGYTYELLAERCD